MLGNWWYFALVIAAVLFTSLGIGFAISIVSQTDSQAVQYSMIILLASVFFSGFIMSLDMLWPPVRVISWMLPTTYGTLLLRDIALRGIDPNWGLLGGLIAIGLVSDAHLLAANAPSDCILTMNSSESNRHLFPHGLSKVGVLGVDGRLRLPSTPLNLSFPQLGGKAATASGL